MHRIDGLKHRKTGETLDKVLEQYVAELDIDEVGIWHLVSRGEAHFSLSGDDLLEFIRRAVLALLNAGAVPVRHVPGIGYDWVLQRYYGSNPDDIANAIVQELAVVPLPWDSFALIEHCPWFTRPEPDLEGYVKMD